MGWDKEAKIVSSEGLNNKYPVDLELEESISLALKEMNLNMLHTMLH